MTRFLLEHLILTVLTYVIGFVFFQFLFSEHFFGFLAALPLIFYAVNVLFYYALMHYSNLDMRKFSARFMMVFGIKIMAFLFFIVAYAYFNPNHAVAFLVTFFILYVINTIFVVVKTIKMLQNR
jgi:L-asparagine transporter-like permease